MKQYIDRSMNYKQYVDMLDNLMSQGKTTGQNQSEDYLNYAKLNLARMHRLNKTATLDTEMKSSLQKVSSKYIFLVITEGWCGDAAQNIPTMHLIELENNNIQLKLILRDENLELMDKYLTNGGRSIPKLICLKAETLEEVFNWGPRPEAVQQTVLELKDKNASLMEKAEIVHKWYATDKTLSLQKELRKLVEKHLV